MSPFLAVFALGNFWVHVCSLDGSDVLSYVEAPVDEHLGIGPTLDVPYIDPYNRHVRFGRDLDNSRFGS